MKFFRGNPQSLNLIPYSENYVIRFNANPYELVTSGDGLGATDPGAWLLSYWLGRYYGYIV